MAIAVWCKGRQSVYQKWMMLLNCKFIDVESGIATNPGLLARVLSEAKCRLAEHWAYLCPIGLVPVFLILCSI
jgi:hypothetical protein